MSGFLRIMFFTGAMMSVCSLRAQFNNLYLTDQRGYGLAVEEDEVTGNYVFPYLYGDPGLGETSLGFLIVASDGSLNSVENVIENQPDLLISETEGFFKTSDGGYLFATGNNGNYLLKLNEDLQLEWEVTNNLGDFTGYWGGQELFNNDLILGYIDPSNPYNILSMHRFSSNGQLLAEFEIELDYNFTRPISFNVNGSVVYVTFHHYIVGEYRRNSIVAYNIFTGEEQWEVHQLENDQALAYTAPICRWNNEGELIYVYFQIEGTELPQSFGMGYCGRLKLTKINLETGEFYQDQSIAEPVRELNPLDAKVTDDGGLVVLSLGYAPTQLPPCEGPLTTVPYGVILSKFDSNYNEEWTYHYTPPDDFNTVSGSKILRDLEITNDDCIIAAGTCSSVFYEPFEYLQHPWLLKVDACGNEMVSDCTLSGLSELSGRNKISIYPNPVRDRVFLKGENNIQEATIFDMNGKIVHHEFFSGAQEQTLFIDHLPDGLYLVQAIDTKDRRNNTKLLVTRY